LLALGKIALLVFCFWFVRLEKTKCAIFGCCNKLSHNVLQLGEVAEIEAQMFSFAQKFNRRTELEFSTEPAILPNCC
jgi:hypothetical protein